MPKVPEMPKIKEPWYSAGLLNFGILGTLGILGNDPQVPALPPDHPSSRGGRGSG